MKNLYLMMKKRRRRKKKIYNNNYIKENPHINHIFYIKEKETLQIKLVRRKTTKKRIKF